MRLNMNQMDYIKNKLNNPYTDGNSLPANMSPEMKTAVVDAIEQLWDKKGRFSYSYKSNTVDGITSRDVSYFNDSAIHDEANITDDIIFNPEMHCNVLRSRLESQGHPDTSFVITERGAVNISQGLRDNITVFKSGIDNNIVIEEERPISFGDGLFSRVYAALSPEGELQRAYVSTIQRDKIGKETILSSEQVSSLQEASEMVENIMLQSNREMCTNYPELANKFEQLVEENSLDNNGRTM